MKNETKKERNMRKMAEARSRARGKGHEKHHNDPLPPVSSEPVLTIVPDDVVEEELREVEEEIMAEEEKDSWDNFEESYELEEESDDDLPS